VLRGGEDWELWLKLKAREQHGVTLPEFLFWYRRKEQRRQWNFLDRTKGNDHDAPLGFTSDMGRARFPQLYAKGHVNPTLGAVPDGARPVLALLDENGGDDDDGGSGRRHAVIIIPSMFVALGGHDYLQIAKLMSLEGWELTIVCTLASLVTGGPDASLHSREDHEAPSSARSEFHRYTEDIMVLPHFIRVEDFGAFMLHLLTSRRSSLVFIADAFSGYNLLPFLGARAPAIAFVDFVHACSGDGDRGSAHRACLSGEFSANLDASMFASTAEQEWFLERIHMKDNAHIPQTSVVRLLRRGAESREKENMLRAAMSKALSGAIKVAMARADPENTPDTSGRNKVTERERA